MLIEQLEITEHPKVKVSSQLDQYSEINYDMHNDSGLDESRPSHPGPSFRPQAWPRPPQFMRQVKGWDLTSIYIMHN